MMSAPAKITIHAQEYAPYLLVSKPFIAPAKSILPKCSPPQQPILQSIPTYNIIKCTLHPIYFCLFSLFSSAIYTPVTSYGQYSSPNKQPLEIQQQKVPMPPSQIQQLCHTSLKNFSVRYTSRKGLHREFQCPRKCNNKRKSKCSLCIGTFLDLTPHVP